MPIRQRFRWMLLIVAVLFFGAVAADALGLFDAATPYRVVPHPTHSHYIPKACGEDVPASNFPTQEPGPGERITCDGRIVPIAE